MSLDSVRFHILLGVNGLNPISNFLVSPFLLAISGQSIMFFLSRFITFRGTLFFAVTTNAFDAVNVAASVLSGETIADLQAILSVFGFSS